MLGHLNLGLILAARKSYDAAALAFQRASSYSPAYEDARGLLAYAYAKAGRHAEAKAIGAEVHRSSPVRPMSGYVRAHYYLGYGDEEQAITELERAVTSEAGSSHCSRSTRFDQLRPHPRFQALLRRMRFPE